MNRVYLDANILLDFSNPERKYHTHAISLITYCLKGDISLFTSCDIITTLYYIDSKKGKESALNNIHKINQFVKIIDFSNAEVEQMCNLMAQNSDFKDLEDTIQYILAKKVSCDCIVSNDQNFLSPDILLLSSEQFCERLGL
ncbi:MAG: PIN domain-containing protein [Campylobacterales bacterium]|nr:PIN domain-containing protein [Campylobacterales bacterium]